MSGPDRPLGAGGWREYRIDGRRAWPPRVRRWSRWREHDPIHLVAKYRDNLRSLSGIYLDCGWRDPFYIRYGACILSQHLAAAGIRPAWGAGVASSNLAVPTRFK